MTLAIDLQSLYPQWLIPHFLTDFLRFWISISNDPILQGGSTDSPLWAWIRSFLALEAVGQIPVFIFGAYGLYKGELRNVDAFVIKATHSHSHRLEERRGASPRLRRFGSYHYLRVLGYRSLPPCPRATTSPTPYRRLGTVAGAAHYPTRGLHALPHRAYLHSMRYGRQGDKEDE